MGRLLGVDFGDSRIGLALSDPLKMIASPYKTIPNKDHLDAINAILIDQEIEAIIVGLPIGLKGQDTAQTEKVKQFAESLNQFNLPVHFEDERLSSVSAQKSMMMQNIKTGHNKGMIDERAAAILLQQYLDKLNR